MSTVIVPTAGRILWYMPSAADKIKRDGCNPLAAMVCGVIPVEAPKPDQEVVEVKPVETEVVGYNLNLSVLDFLGQQHNRQGIPLIQEGEERPEGCYCVWMPYQQGQAKKHGEGAAEASGMSAKDVKSNIDTLYANFRGIGQDVGNFKKEVMTAIENLRLEVRAFEEDAVAADPTEAELEKLTAPPAAEQATGNLDALGGLGPQTPPENTNDI